MYLRVTQSWLWFIQRKGRCLLLIRWQTHVCVSGSARLDGAAHLLKMSQEPEEIVIFTSSLCWVNRHRIVSASFCYRQISLIFFFFISCRILTVTAPVVVLINFLAGPAGSKLVGSRSCTANMLAGSFTFTVSFDCGYRKVICLYHTN